MSKENTLALHLECDPEDVEETGWDTYEAEGQEWLVLTSEEMEERVKEYILDTLWAFRPEFLEAHLRPSVPLQALEAVQGLYEEGNAAVRALIASEEHLVTDAVQTDGYGHFLSPHDGEHHEACTNWLDKDTPMYNLFRVN